MPQLSKKQFQAMMGAGFTHGVIGYPVLWSDNGKVTIVSEQSSNLFVWEFETNGDSRCRSYRRRGERNANIPTSA